MAKFETMKVAELREAAEKRELAGWEDMSKAELIEALTGAGETGNEKEYEPEKPEDEDDEEGDEEEDEPPAPRKPVERPAVEAVEPDQLLSEKARTMKAKCQEEIKNGAVETVFINRAPSEPFGTVESVTINGYRLNIRKGEPVKVPRTFARFLWQMQQDTNVALEHPTKFDAGDKPELEE